MQIKIVEKGKITAGEKIAKDLFSISLYLPSIAATIMPGNFVTILPPNKSGKFLRRPFAAAAVDRERGVVSFVIKKIGAVSEVLYDLAIELKTDKQEEVEVFGPLGNCWEIKAKTLWMFGGGTGIASLLFLNSIRSGGDDGKDRLLWAGKTAANLPIIEDISFYKDHSSQGNHFRFATDDGSAGEEGTGAEIFSRWLESETPDGVVACGPTPMMRAIGEIGEKKGIPVWLSLEEFMACGCSACAGCVVQKRGDADGGYFKVCSDGSIFKYSEVII